MGLLGNGSLLAIHQFHASVAWGDAIGNDLFALRHLFRSWRYRSEIFRVHAQDEVARDTYPVDEYPVAWSSPGNLLLVHYSIGWDSWPQFLRMPDEKILVYHNITPAKFFEGICENTARLCRQGKEDLPRLARYFSAAIADSAFNADELRQAGFRNVVVIPPLIDFSQYHGVGAALGDSETAPDSIKWLFVGRISPNKRHEDVIRAFAYYQQHMQPMSKLFIVGSDDGMEQYSSRLRKLARELEVDGVRFAGKVPFDDLIRFYRCSNVFVCLSEHEGLCIPILEAMRFGLPVIAYSSTAVAETLQDSGILLDEKCPEKVAEAVERLVSDLRLKESVIEKQYNRLKDFAYEKVAGQMESFLAQFGARPRSREGKRKIKVACATLRYYPYVGGTEVVLQNVFERLVKDGFDCTVYATVAKSVDDIFASSQGPETEEWINGIRVVRSPITDPPKKAWLARNLDRFSIYGHGAWSYRQFGHLLKDKYDILHTSPFPSTHNCFAYSAARLRGKPLVCSPHLHIADAYHSDRWSLFAMMRGAAAVIAITPFERDFCIQRGVPARRIHLTGVGIDPFSLQQVPQLPQSALEFPGFTSAKKFLFLGRKDSKKGITDVVNALRLLCLRYPNVILVCAGPETSYSKSLWQEIPESLQPHLLVLDTVSEAEKRALILDSEALILMSTTESFGIVFLEAWLEGKPVIGARAGAIEAVIEDGADGLLVEPGNYVELAATMQFLLEHPEVGAELGARGKAKTLRQFTWDAVAEQWSRIFWEINKSE